MNMDAELADKRLASHLKALVEDAEELMNATAGQAGEEVSRSTQPTGGSTRVGQGHLSAGGGKDHRRGESD